MNKGDKRNYNVFFNTHTVSGIIISFGLFVCFFAGAFALFMDNINNWESNKKESHHSKVIDYERALAVVEADGYNMDGRRFSFFLRESKPPYIQISSGKNKVELDTTETGEPIPLSEADSLANASFFLKLDPSTYEIIGRKFERSPQLGTYIYRLHYFGQIPAIGVYLSGLVALFFLFAILTGVIVHWKKIVSNFFTFRLKASIKNLWTDSHTALGIIGLPFQFMYAVTGTFYGLSILILIPTVMILFDGDQEAALKYVFPAGEPVEKANVYQADRVNMNDLVAEAMDQIGNPEMHTLFVTVTNFNDENANLTVDLRPKPDENFFNYAYVRYQLSNGEILDQKPLDKNPYNASVFTSIRTLHYAEYGGYFVKGLYFIFAMITCFVIMSGVMVWLVARDKKAYEHRKRFNKNVGAIYLGISLGLYPAIALFFCLVKVIPTELESHFMIASTTFFLFWLGFAIYSFVIKSPFKINKHALLLAGVLGLLIPVFNGLQSGLWFWKSLPMGYTDSFFIDIAWIGMAAISLFAAFKAKPVVKKERIRPARTQTAVTELETHPTAEESIQIAK